jgi:hypothetical protein
MPMSYAGAMLRSNPKEPIFDAAKLEECIQACFDCAQACVACADACLGEQDTGMLLRCIRLDLDCADICATTGRMLSRQAAGEPTLVRALVQACAEACHLCGEECARHGEHGMEHCRVCAEACRRCEQACRALIGA